MHEVMIKCCVTRPTADDAKIKACATDCLTAMHMINPDHASPVAIDVHVKIEEIPEPSIPTPTPAAAVPTPISYTLNRIIEFACVTDAAGAAAAQLKHMTAHTLKLLTTQTDCMLFTTCVAEFPSARF